MSNHQQYPGQPRPGDQTPRQQQQPTVGHQSSGVTPVVLYGKSDVSFTDAIVVSCMSFWCAGGLFGLIAFILAMVGKNAAGAGDDARALRLRNASYFVSIVGIVIGVGVVLGVLLGVYVPQHANNTDTGDSFRQHNIPYYDPSDRGEPRFEPPSLRF